MAQPINPMFNPINNPIRDPINSFGGVNPEINNDQNAILVGADVNTTTNWNSVALSSGGNQFISQNSVVNGSSFAFLANSNPNPLSGSRFTRDILNDFSLTIGKSYTINVDLRHIGTGGNWFFTLSSAGTLLPNMILVTTLDNTETTFVTYELVFTATSNTVFLGGREDSGANDGGIYVDNFSLKLT